MSEPKSIQNMKNYTGRKSFISRTFSKFAISHNYAHTLMLLLALLVMGSSTTSAKIVDSWIAGRDVNKANVEGSTLLSSAYDSEGTIKSGEYFDLQLSLIGGTYSYKPTGTPLGLNFGGEMKFEYVQGSTNGKVGSGFTEGAYFTVKAKAPGTFIAYINYSSGSTKNMYVFNGTSDQNYKVDGIDHINSDKPALNALSPAKLEFEVVAGKTYTFGVTGSKMMLLGVMLDDGEAEAVPTITATPTVDMSLNSYTIEKKTENAITISGSNLTDGTYEVTSSDAAITVTPNTFTVSGGILSETQFAVTYHEDAAADKRNGYIYFATKKDETPEALGVTAVTLSKVAQRGLTEATTIEERTTWDWRNTGTTEVKLIDPNNANSILTNPQKQDGDTYSVLGNIAEITNDATFNSGAINIAGEFMVREGSFAQASHIKFHVAKAGKVSVTFSSTSGDRNLYINGTDTEVTSTGAADKHTVTKYVEAGDVILTGKKSKSVNPGDYLRYYTIVYEPEITEAPEITSDLDASCDMYVGEQKNLSITATGLDTTYQWSTCDDALGTNPKAIVDATSSSYTFNPSLAGTYYIYCTATNDVGSTRSRIATINVTVDSNIAIGITTPWNNATKLTGNLEANNPTGSHVTVESTATNAKGLNFTNYNAASNQTFYHGTSDSYTIQTPNRCIKNTYNDKNNDEHNIKTQAGATDGAETFGTFIGFKVSVDEGYKMTIAGISSDIYAQDGVQYGYEYIIEDVATGNQLYKSPVYSITSAKTSAENLNNSVAIPSSASLKDIRRDVMVKLLWWSTGTGKYIALKDFAIKATVEEITEDPASPTITTNVPAVVNGAEPGKAVDIAIVGEHYKTIQWYKNTTNSIVGGVPVDGQTKATLSYIPTTGEKNSTLYFYAVLNNPNATGTKNATTNVVAVNVGARKDCKLISLALSNGFNAFVEMNAGVVEGYYMADESAPTVDSYVVSDGATFSLEGNTITVTAEDGTTKKTYELQLAAVQPLTDAGLQTMSNTPPAWVKGGHWHNSAPLTYEAWKHTDQYMQNGYNRVYFFVGPCELLHIEAGDVSRFVKGGKGTLTTYINGKETQTEVTLPAVGEYINIPCSTEHNTMIEIVNLSETNEWGFLTVQQDKKLNVTYTKGGDIEGKTPDNLVMASIGAHFTTPMTNYSLYKPGYTMTGWTDDENNYDFNTDYPLTKDLTLSPIWQKNGLEAEDVNGHEVQWLFGMKNNGGIFVPTMNLNDTTGETYYVTQTKLDGTATDMAMTIQNGLFENLNTNGVENATVGTGTEFTVRAVRGATIEVRSAYENYSIKVLNNGSEIGTMLHVADGGIHCWRYTIDRELTGDKVTLKFTFNGSETKDGKIYYLKVIYPTKNASDLTIEDGKSIIKLDYNDPKKKTHQLTKDTDYTTSSEGRLEYLSSDESIATVSSTGLITAIAGGDVTISIIQKGTATYAGGRIDFAVNVPFPATLRFFNGTLLVDGSHYAYTGEAIGEGKIPAAPSPATTGQNFVGWYTTANGIGVKATPYTIINEPTDFYAFFMDAPELVDGYYQLGLVGTENPGQKGDKLVNAITWATRQAPADEAHRIKIWIPNGTYNLRELTCTEVGSYISLIGESQNGVVIQNMPEREGIDNTATLKVTGNQVVMQNLTLKNVIEEEAETTDAATNITYQRGVCLEDCGVGNVYREVRLLGRQNTYYASDAAVKSYFENSEIHGTIDMIGGEGNVWFEDCQLKIEQNTAAYIVGAKNGTFTLNGCTISNADGASMTGKYYLGHGLHAEAKIYFNNTTKSIAYKESGWGKSVSGAMTSESTSAATPGAETTIGTSVNNANKLAEPTGVVVNEGKVTWTAVDGAAGYVLYRGGERVTFLATNEYTLPQGAATNGYTVATISATGIIGDAATETTAPVITKDLTTTMECYVGKPQNLAIEATGSTTTYQWYKSSTRGSYVIVADPANAIDGATTASYRYIASAEGDAWFCCKASNSQGDTYSTVVMVTAKKPVITQDLNKTYGAVIDKEKIISITAEGGDTYQWYTCDDAQGTNPQIIEGATSAMLSQTWAATGTHYIYCTVNGIINSAIATVTVGENAGGGEKTYHEDTIFETYDFASLTAGGAPNLALGSTPISQAGGTNPLNVYLISNPKGTVSGQILELNERFAVNNTYNSADQMRWMWRSSANAYQNGLAGNWNAKGAVVSSINLSVLKLYAGDKVTINYSYRNADAYFYAVAANQVNLAQGEQVVAKRTYTVADAVGTAGNGQFDIYCTNNNVAIQSIVIETHYYATAEPQISRNLPAATKAYKGVPRVLAIEGQDADTYQWYKATSAESTAKSTATPVDGATTPDYVFTPTAAGTEYYFCVASNSNGSVASNITAVTVTDAVVETFDFNNWDENDRGIVLGTKQTTQVADGTLKRDVYNVEYPLSLRGYMAIMNDDIAISADGLKVVKGSGNRAAMLVGVSDGDLVTFLGTGLNGNVIVNNNELGNVSCLEMTNNEVKSIEVTSNGNLGFLLDRYANGVIKSIIITHKPTPTFTQNINDKYFLSKGADQTLTVAATGADTYQWYRNSIKSNRGGEAISGATSATYTVPTSENGTDYYYCIATNTANNTVAVSNLAQVDVADIIFRDFELDVRQKRSYGLTAKEISDKSAVEFGVNVGEDGTLSRVEKNDANYSSANVIVSGTYENTTLGLKNVKFIVPVQGKVKFSVGRTDNADSALYGDVTVTDAAGNVVATLSTKGGKWASNKKNIDYGYYSGGATTLTFSTDKYVPYFRIEAVEVSASEAPTITQGTYSVADRQWTYTMTTNAEGATIYYTTDGTDPTTESSSVINGGNVLIPANATIKAYAVCDNWYDSAISTATAPAAPAAKDDAMISFNNGETGNNVGIPYTVSAATNGGQPQVFEDGLKFIANQISYKNNEVDANGYSFRINVNLGYRITGVSVKGLTVTSTDPELQPAKAMGRAAETQVEVTGIYADLQDIHGATNYLSEPKTLPVSTDVANAVEFASSPAMSAESYVDIMTSGAGQANLQVSVSYEYADAISSVTIDGVALTDDQMESFNSGTLTIDESYSGVPTIVVTTEMGYTYTLEQSVSGDNHVYTFDKIGAEKTITLTKVQKPLPVITFNETKFYFGERDGSGNVTNRGYNFTITPNEGGLMVSIDGAAAVPYTTGMRAIETVEAYYTASGLYPDTHVTAYAVSTDYDKTKPFAAYVYTNGYNDSSLGDLYPLETKMIIDGIRTVYNVVNVEAGEANPNNAASKSNLDAADLVVMTEAMSSSASPLSYVNTKDEDISLPNNILNLKLHAVKSSVWNWHSGGAQKPAGVSITPGNANYSIFNGVAFDDNVNNSITLWNDPTTRDHLVGLAQGSYTSKVTRLTPEMQSLATVTVADVTYDVLEYFTNNNHTFVQFGLSINDYRHYNENVKTIVSNICEMINAGKALNTVAGELTTPVITDNHDGTATIRTSIPLATIKYVAVPVGSTAPDAAYINANGTILKGQTTVQYSNKRDLYAIAIYNTETTAVAGPVAVSGSKMFKITRTAELVDGVTGLDVTGEYDSSTANLKVPYNQSFRKEGYSVKKWKDQDGNEYIPGAALELDKDLVLTAVWEENTKTVADFTDESDEQRTATFNFLMKDGAPEMKLDGNFYGVLVGQVHFSDNDFIDVVAEMTGRETLNPQSGRTDAGKVQNNFTNSWNWLSGDGTKPAEYCQIKTGTVFTFPAVYGMTVNFKATDLERDEDASRQLQVHRSYISNTTLSDGVLTNPAYEVVANNYVLTHDNYAEGGIYTYSGETQLAELVVRESSMVYERTSINEPKANIFDHEPGWNDNSIFMDHLSVTYPVLYYVQPNLDPAESAVAEGQPTANISYEPKAPENTNGKFKDGMAVKMIVTPTYAYKFNGTEGTTDGVTIRTTGADVPEDGAVYTFTMPADNKTLTIPMLKLETREIKSSPLPLNTGRVVYTPDYTSFVDGKTVKLTATPKVGYEFKGWFSDDAGKTPITGDGGIYVANERDLTFTVSQTTGTTTHYAKFEKGYTGTVHYLISKAILLDENGIVEKATHDLTADDKAQTEGFPRDTTMSAMIIPTYYTMYKEGYTLDHWQACDENGVTLNTGGDNDGRYNIGSYYYYANEGDERYIKPVFKKNNTDFDYRTTDVDITWDFRTAYFAQSMEYGNNKTIHYSTHSTINRPGDASGEVTMDVPITINTGKDGKVNNLSLDEWCSLGEGTTIQIPSGLDATFTLVTYAPVTSTKIDDDVLTNFVRKKENNLDVYVYTYQTKSPKTSVTLTIGDDFAYYKYLRAQLPSAEKVAVNTSVNVPYMGTAQVVSTGTKPDGDDLDIQDVTAEVHTDGARNFLAPLGSYVTIEAKRNRLYEFEKWVDGNGNDIVADGENIIITTDIDAETGDVTSKMIYRLLEYITDVKAIFKERAQYQINYTAGTVATGIAPTVTVIERGESFALPVRNQVLYYEGHTLKYWVDEKGNKYDFNHTYTPGKTFQPDGSLPSGTAAFIVPNGNIRLTPVFEPNEFSLGDILNDVTVTWPLAKADGASSINFRKSSGVIVSQLEYDGMAIDLALNVLSYDDSGMAYNAEDDNYCNITTNMMIGVPAAPGSKIILNSYEDVVTTTEIGRYRGEQLPLDEREKGGDADGYKDGTEIAGSTSTTSGALTAGAYTAGVSPEVTCTNADGYGTLDIYFKGDATTFTSIQAVYSAITIPMPELQEVSIGGVKLGSGIYGKYSVVDLNSDKSLNNVRVNAIGEKLPEVKATTVNGLGVVSITQPTVADPTATIIVKTDKGIIAGVYVINFKVGRVTGTPKLTQLRLYRQQWKQNSSGVYDHPLDATATNVIAPNSVLELTFDRVMAQKQLDTDTELTWLTKANLAKHLPAAESETLQFTLWDLEMGKDYDFKINANTLEDVYGNPYTEDIHLKFTVSNVTMQNMRKAPYDFVVTHKETFDHSIQSDNREAQKQSREQVATDELIANLEAANIPYGTIDEAVEAANANKENVGFFIFVPDGEYQIGGNTPMKPNRVYNMNKDGAEVDLSNNKLYNNGMTHITRPTGKVSIIGQSQDKTVIFNDPYFYGISYTSTMEIRREASDCYFQDLTFDNRYSWHQMQNGTTPGGQSVAFYDRGRRTILKNVSVLGFQDSYASAPSDALLLADRMGNCYYEDCTFAGTVDFLCGEGDIWWERCKFLLRHRASNNICAPRQLDYQKWGYIFSNCTVDAEDEAKSHAYMTGWTLHPYEATRAINDGNFTLGRPWDGSPAATYLYTTLNIQPKEVGWASMKDEGLTLRFQEYGTMAANGERIDLSQRTTTISTPGPGSYDAVMSPSDVERYNAHDVLGNNLGYDPTVYTEQRPAVIPGFDDTELSWHEDNYALLYAIFKSDTEDGEYKLFAITTDHKYDCGEEAGWYKVRTANQRGGLGEWSKAVQYVPVDRYTLVLNHTKSGASECRDNDNNPVGWSTICLPFNAKVPETDIEGNPVAQNFRVYAATRIQDNTITLKRVHYITQNIGYVVYGSPDQYLFKGSSHTALEYDGYESLLDGNPTDQNITAAGTNCYTLSYKPNVAGIGFYKYVGTYLNARKAYLTVDVFTAENEKNATASPSTALQTANSKGIRFVFEDFDHPTGIDDVTIDDADETTDAIYDLMGRRIRRQDMRRGNVYIINGKTVRM